MCGFRECFNWITKLPVFSQEISQITLDIIFKYNFYEGEWVQ